MRLIYCGHRGRTWLGVGEYGLEQKAFHLGSADQRLHLAIQQDVTLT